MVFSSHLFLFYFLPAALLLYYLMPRAGKHILLTLVSYVFYGWANPLFMGLLLVSTLIEYIAGLVIAWNGFHWGTTAPVLAVGAPRTRKQRAAFVVSICSNLSLLGFFKYFNFAVENIDALAAWLGWPGLGIVLRVTLPLGISFYTFQSMSYAIDVYRGQAAALRSFVDLACYVAMFPQLLAGPIIRFSEVADQLVHRVCTVEKFARGVAFLCLGLSKKILLANPCGKIADVAFLAASPSTPDAWYGIFAYAFQIYFDFSGYSDIAIGLGLMLGFVFAKNFDSPYKAKSISEFWRKWHISLSSMLRDFIFLPLAYAISRRITSARLLGMRAESWSYYPAMFLTMLLCGLWHGAAWNFVIWGGIHGGLLGFERIFGKRSLYTRAPRALRIAATFLMVLVAWVFFRAPDLPAAFQYLGRMAGFGTPAANAFLAQGIFYQPYYLLTMVVAGGVTWLAPQTWDWTREISWPKALVILGAGMLAVAVLFTQSYNPFIYFIF